MGRQAIACRRIAEKSMKKAAPNAFGAACAMTDQLPAVAVVIMSAMSVAIMIIAPAMPVIPVMSISDVSRAVMPGAGNPNLAGRVNRPVTRGPHVTRSRAGRGGLYHGHGCG